MTTSPEQLAEEYWQWRMSAYPEQATYYGYPGQNSRWTDLGPDEISSRKSSISQFLDRVRATPESDDLNRRLLLHELSSRDQYNRFPNEKMALSPMGGPHTACAQVLKLMPRTGRDSFEDILARLGAYPTYLAQSVELLRSGLGEGITQPKIVLRAIEEQISSQITQNAAESPILQAIGEVPDEVTAEAASTYEKEVVPALEDLKSFVSREYLPKAREATALSAMPDGRDWYQMLIGYYTTTDMTAQQIHEVGLEEVARISDEMKAIYEEQGYPSFEAFTSFLRDDPGFFFDDPDELITAYRDICKRADPELAALFGTLPRLPYGVLPVPAYIAKTTTTAYYQPGSPDVGRPGYFYANTYDLKSRPKWEMEALSLHEAVPGHHLQIALASELSGIPEFRKHSLLTAYIEGWGLYSESLGSQMGFYKDPFSRFGQLAYEMWRAVSLVVDTGLHELGWERERAIDYFVKNTGKMLHDATVEVDRYISWPGQALAYKIGELKIKQVRARAEEALADSFDIRSFHDAVLGEGPLPLSILEEQIEAWIAGS